MYPSRRTSLIAFAAVAVGFPLAMTACSSDKSDDAGDGKTTITVAGMSSTQTDPGAHTQFLAAVAAFEKLHPDITVKPSEYAWAADTFSARLASGQLETVFLVPFTEPQKLIKQQQVADITANMGDSADLGQLNPKLLAAGQADGKTYGIPIGGYAVGLLYNRALFTKAGLDPDRPPTTWEAVAEDARKIAALGGDIAGYIPITENNFGGWFLAMMNASHGNAMEVKGSDGKYRSSFNNDQGVAALTELKNMRWTDNSTGQKSLLSLDDAQKQMAAGKLGMFLGAGDWLQPIIQNNGGSRADFGMGPMPQAGGNATLMGGQMAMVNPRADAAQRKAAVAWIEFEYLRTHSDPTATAAYYADLAKTSGAVLGFPELPLFTTAVQNTFEEARKPYVTVPTQNYAPYTQSLTTLSFQSEPPVDAQQMYKILDGVLQKTLSDRGADPKALLDSAAEQVDSLLSHDQP